VTLADHIQKVLKPNFAAAWDEVGDDFEKEETFALASVRTLDGKSEIEAEIIYYSLLLKSQRSIYRSFIFVEFSALPLWTQPRLITFSFVTHLWSSCTEAVGNIISFLGMQPCERSDKVPENKNSHVLFLAGGCRLSGWFRSPFGLFSIALLHKVVSRAT